MVEVVRRWNHNGRIGRRRQKMKEKLQIAKKVEERGNEKWKEKLSREKKEKINNSKKLRTSH